MTTTELTPDQMLAALEEWPRNMRVEGIGEYAEKGTGKVTGYYRGSPPWFVNVRWDRGAEQTSVDLEAAHAGLRPILDETSAPVLQPDVAPMSKDEEERLERLQAEEEHEDETFWDRRDELRHVKDFARARYANPWATLGAVLVRVVCQIPPTVVIPPIVAGEAALNLYLVMEGPSGAGKQSAEAVAEEAFVYGAHQVTETIGSGEGIPKAYRKPVKVTQDSEAPSDGWIERSILWRSSEIDNLAAQKNRAGATVMNVLRDAWNGDKLGFAYADAGKKVDVPARSYRAGVIVGAQPDRVEAILGREEAAGGTPQRFLWMPAQDRSLPALDALSPEEQDAILKAEAPTPRHWVKPEFNFGFTNARSGNRHVVVPWEVSRVIRMEAIKRNRGEAEALDGHALLNRLKVACALAFLAGRPDVEVEDWELAGAVMAKSDATRAGLVAGLEARRKTAKRMALMDDIEVNLEGEDHAKALTMKKVKASLRRYLADGEWHSRSALRKKLKARPNAAGIAPRDVFDDAIKDLINDRVVQSKPGESNNGGLLYSLDR